MISFLDLSDLHRDLNREIMDAVSRVVHSGYYILGPEVERFEEAWAKVCQASYCLGVSNGLDALKLALVACGVGKDDEVIVPSNTFIATWLAVTHLGAKVVPVEPNINDYNIDVNKIEERINDRTKAIIGVHLYGHPCDLETLRVIAKRNGLFLIEDAAQAHGAEYKSRPIGSLSDVACWSFYPGKNLGALGDAGAITTNNNALYERIKMLRNYGSKNKYHNEVVGYNARMDPIQAAILHVKLRYLDSWQSRRRKIAELFLKRICNERLILPFSNDNIKHAWHLFVIRTNERDLLLTHLKNSGVETVIHYPVAPHRQDAYQGYDFKLPIADELSTTSLSIPNRPNLTNDQIDYICDILNKFDVQNA